VFTVFRYIRFCLRISEIRLQRQGLGAAAHLRSWSRKWTPLAWADKHADMVTQPRYFTLQRALADPFPCPK